MVQFLEFTYFTEYWTFHEVGVNHKEKEQGRKVEMSEIPQKKLADKRNKDDKDDNVTKIICWRLCNRLLHN